MNAPSASEEKRERINYLRDLRRELEITERDFSEHSGMAKTTLRYIETTKSWASLKNSEIAQYAKGLNITPDELVKLHGLKVSGKDFLTRFSYKEPQNEILLSEGVKLIIVASIKYPFDSLEGQLELSPAKSLTPDKRPVAKHVRWKVIEGNVVVYMNGSEMIRKKDEGFILYRDIDYEIYNPNSVQKAVLSVVTFPSFIHIGK